MIKRFVSPPSRRARIAGFTAVGLGAFLMLPWQVTAVPLQEKNQVTNGGFESGRQGWERSTLPPNADPGVVVEVDGTTAHSGKSSLKFSKTAKRYFPVECLDQVIPFEGGAKRLRIGLWAKAQEVGKATISVFFDGARENEGHAWGAYVGIANDSDSVANHDWKKYGSVVAIPEGTTGIRLSVQMYGPGTIWIDDISAEYVAANTPLKSATAPGGAEDAEADVKDVPNEELRAQNDSLKKYFLIGAQKGSEAEAGQKLIVVLPGGDGSAGFNPFVRRIWKHGLDKSYVIAQLVAPKWSDDQFEQIVWPTRKNRWKTMKFSTEELIEAVVKDVKTRVKVDDNHIYTLSWSSGGPAAYAAALSSPSIKGSFVAMSVFKPDELGSLSGAKGRKFYILHSPQDFIPIRMAQQAEKDLAAAGGVTKLQTYEGGHGWTSEPYLNIQKGIEWLTGAGG